MLQRYEVRPADMSSKKAGGSSFLQTVRIPRIELAYTLTFVDTTQQEKTPSVVTVPKIRISII